MGVLITGGAGFIGSTIASALIDRGHRPVILDNLGAGLREFTLGRVLYEGDIADRGLIRRVFAGNPQIAMVVHCAALTVVPDSVAAPLRYYRENVSKTTELVDAMLEEGCDRIVFSSSASIYRPESDLTVNEDSAFEPLSPYAVSKAMVEQILRDVSRTSGPKAMILRYFNPIGADPQMRTGPQFSEPSHALAKLISAHQANRIFAITGVDYPIRDGTGMQDYIHVWDLAKAHVNAVEHFDDAVQSGSIDGALAIYLGTGRGTTVRELIAAFDRVTGDHVKTYDLPRRPGDTVGAHTVSSRARRLLGWCPELDLERGIADALTWFDRRTEVIAALGGQKK